MTKEVCPKCNRLLTTRNKGTHWRVWCPKRSGGCEFRIGQIKGKTEEEAVARFLDTSYRFDLSKKGIKHTVVATRKGLARITTREPCPRCHLTMFDGKCSFCLPGVEGFIHRNNFNDGRLHLHMARHG